MQLSDYDQLDPDKKIEINKFIEENVETIYDERKSYKTYINLNNKHLEIDDISETGGLVGTNFVGYWCKKCEDWVKGTADISLIEHVLEHLNNKEYTSDYDDSNISDLAT